MTTTAPGGGIVELTLGSQPAAAAVALTSEATGQPSATAPDSPPTWDETSNGTVIKLSPTVDGLGAVVTAVAVGEATITVHCAFNGVPKLVSITARVIDPSIPNVALSLTPA